MAFLLRANITHLDDDEGVLVRRSGGKEHVGIELTGAAFDTVSEMLDQRGGRCSVEAAMSKVRCVCVSFVCRF